MHRSFPVLTPLQWAVVAVDAAGWVALSFFAWHYFVTCAC